MRNGARHSSLAGAAVVAALAACATAHGDRRTGSLIADPGARNAGTPQAARGDRSAGSRREARGVRLADLTWVEAERVLTPETVVVIPIGAASKEHGPHLKLSNDFKLAEYFAQRVLEAEDVVVAPTIAYSFYPAFLEYPGSTSLSLETSRDVVVEVCESLARHGPRRFYALNTGISTVRALEPAAEKLAAEGILLRFTDLARLEPVEKEVCKQEVGTHADEAETSMLLYIDPACVDMSKAVKDCHPGAPGGLTRDPDGKGIYSPTGTWGDPTLATRAKGETLCEALVRILVGDIEALRREPIAEQRR